MSVGGKNSSGAERRKFRRTQIQESFSLFIVIPNKQGMARIYLRDLSRSGLCFKMEVDGNFKAGQEFELRLYTSPAFYLALDCRVVRADAEEIAVEFKNPASKAAEAIGKLQEFIELAVAASN